MTENGRLATTVADAALRGLEAMASVSSGGVPEVCVACELR